MQPHLNRLRAFIHRFTAHPASFQFGLPALLYIILLAQVPRVAGPELWPSPDAAEYALLTDALIHGHPPTLAIGGHAYPSRYPLVYPLLSAVPAKLIGWATALQHKPYSYLTRLYWISILFGLAATLLLVHVGAWLTNSRLAAMLAGLFFATHPALQRWAAVNMGDTAMLALWLAALAALRPWLSGIEPLGEFFSRRNLILRAAAAALLFGLLTVAKAPFAFWLVATAALLFLRARRNSAMWPPLFTYLLIAALPILSEFFYRRWAYGSPFTNGYVYWEPQFYAHLTNTFNLTYLIHPATGTLGNLRYYAHIFNGTNPLFYAPFFTLLVLITISTLILLYRKHLRPVPVPTPTAWLLFAWLALGAIFCLTYFFQSERFPLLWTPLLDLLPAWLIGFAWRESHYGESRGRRAMWQICSACLAIYLLVAQIELRADAEPFNSDFNRPARTQQLPALLSLVPANAWLFTNYELPQIQRLRPTPGPCGTLYIYAPADTFFNGNASQAVTLNLPPATSLNWNYPPAAPAEFRNSVPALFNAQAKFALPGATLDTFPDFYILIFRPANYPTIAHYLDTQILPQLRAAADLAPINTAGDMTLYRVRLHSTPPPA